MRLNSIIIFIFLILGLMSISNAVTNLTACQNITSSGEYHLNQSIVNSSENICIDIQVDNVSLDCLGNTIDGISNAPTTFSIYINNKTNVSVNNCLMKDWFIPIKIENSNNLSFNNISLYNNMDSILLINSLNNYFSNLNIYNSTNYGLVLNNSNLNQLDNISTYNNSNKGIYLYYSDNNTLNNINSFNNGDHGFRFEYSNYNDINNSVYIYWNF